MKASRQTFVTRGDATVAGLAAAAEAFGGLDLPSERKLREIADTLERTGTYEPKQRRDLSPGVVVTREWNGAVHRVAVTTGGFEYDGRRFKSLSDVARTITGTRWSGPRFFGLEAETQTVGAQGCIMTSKRQIRCAIYTRKSTEEGLEQDFNTLHAQREACEAYVLSQKAEGWVASREHFDDGGFSGGTLERPALKRLLKDIEAGNVDVVVVYKIDRLSRSLMDFAKLVEVFERRSVTFVSVTQSFNTTTSMGRLTLNVLLSFAQFEREVTGERIRDKFAASKKKGMWMGGCPPLGYDIDSRKLVVNAAEAKTANLIFRRYLDLGCVRALRDDLADRRIVSKVWTSTSGRAHGGPPSTGAHSIACSKTGSTSRGDT